MKVVLCAHDMEPMAVVQIGPALYEALGRAGVAQVLVQEPSDPHAFLDEFREVKLLPPALKPRTVYLTAERLAGGALLLLMASDDENGRLLRDGLLSDRPSPFAQRFLWAIKGMG